ncbi:MAG: 1,4-dihydroxy-2-naphthoate octaprenyltransferase [Haloplasmataceae bacterium]|jgi:1,4-dihydroxy-2-naphthoate octaprenyltransferase|nr:1,4-dihydroxy-2-naphthoate octaprenyltransferase [Haloplasmataceae bacterium]
MKLKSFLKLVELPTKVASVTPFLLGTVYAIYHFDKFNLINFLLMLVSLLCIDMATTAINNYIDYKKANKKEGYGYESHNAIVKYNLKESVVISTILILLIIAILFGVLLYLNTNMVVLILGALSFVIGILYSFGPVPISRTPFGEIFSGSIMGFIISFLAIYIHVYDLDILNIVLSNGTLTINIDFIEVLYILLVSIPLAVGIANIMLGNNLCDIEDDIENKRYTLPIYIGRKNGLIVYKALYYLGYIAIIVALILRILPLISILVLLTFLIVNKNIKIFFNKQSKAETFVLAVKNFVIMNITLVLSVALGIILKSIF